MSDTGRSTRDYVINLFISSVFWLVLRLPYRWRIPFVGWFMARLVAPLAGYSKRIRANLAHTCPDMPMDQVDQLCREVPNNVGRTLIEIYSGEDFIARVRDAPLMGDGADALEQAHKENRPVILVTGHFGNYDAPRAALIARGYRVGAIYMPMKNAYFNDHYEAAISTIGTPLFPRGRRGLGQMVRFLRSGGMTGFLVDQYMSHGAPLTFFGQVAPTALSAAELALKYDALLVPIYGIRAENGLDFTIVVDPPIPPSDAETMTQALNDNLENLVRKHMGQWFWIHRRWKPERQRNLAAAKIGP